MCEWYFTVVKHAIRLPPLDTVQHLLSFSSPFPCLPQPCNKGTLRCFLAFLAKATQVNVSTLVAQRTLNVNALSPKPNLSCIKGHSGQRFHPCRSADTECKCTQSQAKSILHQKLSEGLTNAASLLWSPPEDCDQSAAGQGEGWQY